MDVFQLWGKIAIDNAQANSAIDGTSKKASVFGDVLKANLASNAITAGVKKLASAVVEIGTAAYESYAEYEQLAGGAELMFGTAYNTVAQNAKEAYKTVQMSQNEYLTQVNGLATGLKTALGGNAEAAADLAHKVVVAEADVVAATGNTQEAVQNAFNGIMKSNYTMLDNLQLGITPTKEGFQQLIDKVNDWNAANGQATNYTIDNVADAQSALVDYIEMQGLSEYAANEAADTIQGSTASMKAAWENLSTGMADETADMEQLTKDFVDSVEVAAGNIIPRVKSIAVGVGAASLEAISYLRDSSQAIDLVVTVIEDLGIVAASTGAVVGAKMAAGAVKNVATVFTANAKALAYFTEESGKAAVQEAALNGTFSIAETVVGVLTGKITLATVAQSAWNNAMNANPIVLVVAACAALGIAAKNAYNSVKDLSEEMAGTPETAAEAAAKLEELNEQYQYISDHQELYTNTLKWSEALLATKDAIKETEATLESLMGAEGAAAVVSGEVTAQSLKEAEEIQAAAETYSESVQAIVDDYYKTYQSIYDGLHNMGTAFTQIVKETEISWSDAMSNIEQNTQFLERMDDNMALVSQAAEDAGINIDGFKQMLSKMSDSDAAGLVAALATELGNVGTNSTKADEILSNLSSATERYANAGADAASLMAIAVADVDTQLAEALKDYTDTVEGFDQAAEAIQAATNTMQGLIDGITSESPVVLTQVETLIDQIETGLDAREGAQTAGESTMQGLTSGIEIGTPGVLNTIDTLASQMKSRLQTSFADFILTINAKVNASAAKESIPGAKTGLDRVPYDDYLVYLHKDEAVLTAAEARAWRAGKAAVSSSGTGDSEDGGNAGANRGVTVIQYIQSVAQTPVELAAATEAYFTQARWCV